MESEDCIFDVPGCVGAIMDEFPLLTTAHVRPYVVALLLHRCGIRYSEIISVITPQCRQSDLIVGGWDPLTGDYCEGTRLEALVDEVLGEMTGEGILRYNEEIDVWVLTTKCIADVISWAAATGGQLPKHLLMEMSDQQICRIPDYIELESVVS